MNYDTLPIYRDSYNLVMEIFIFSHNLSREYKYTIGERLKSEILEMMIEVWRAMLATDDKMLYIKNARRHIETIRLIFRIMKDLRQIALERFAVLSEKLEVVAKQLASWQIKIAKV